MIRKAVDTDGDDDIDRAKSYVYDGEDVVLVFDETRSLASRFLHGPAVDQVFAQEDSSGEILWGLADNLGTVRDVVDYDAGTDTTTVANHLKYDAYGNITAESNSSVEFRYAYTGRFFDEDTGLQYNRARWYDATVGKWISEDPIGFAAGDPNVSRYVSNSPTNLIDPSGLDGGLPDPPTTESISITPPAEPPAPVEHKEMSDEQYEREKAKWDANVGEKRDTSWYGEETVLGQLVCGDIYGNQIWGDFGIYINGGFSWGPVHYGHGFELIYD